MARPKKLPPGIRLLTSGRYQARYPITENGVTRQVTAGTFATIGDAKDARNAAMVAYRNGTWVDPKNKKITVEEWAKEWQQLHKIGAQEASFLRARIVPYWGARRLVDVEPIHIQRWVNLLVGEGLSPRTVRGLYATLKRMFASAVDYDVLVKSPCRTVTVPPRTKTKVVVLSAEQLALLEQNAPDRYRAMIHLGGWAGLRWGECAALRWEDVDLEAGLIHVCRGVTVQRTVGSTKNGKDRYVKIAPETVDLLRAHRRDFGDREWVFTTGKRGVRLGYSEFRRFVWLPLVEKCELDPAPTFHSLRHAHAGHMVMRGLDWKVLADRLGHHAPSFTADVYGWKRTDADDVTVAAIQAAMHSE